MILTSQTEAIMRMRIGDQEVEGTPEEIADLIRLLADTGRPRAKGPQADKAGSADGRDETEQSPFVSEDTAVAILTRRPLAPTYITLLHRLKEAGDRWTSAPVLQSAVGMTTREFAGLLGAFGRRVSHTDGTRARFFFDQYWDHERGYNLYRLPPSVRAAIDRIGLTAP